MIVNTTTTTETNDNTTPFSKRDYYLLVGLLLQFVAVILIVVKKPIMASIASAVSVAIILIGLFITSSTENGSTEVVTTETEEDYIPEGVTYIPEGVTYVPEGVTYIPEGVTYFPEEEGTYVTTTSEPMDMTQHQVEEPYVYDMESLPYLGPPTPPPPSSAVMVTPHPIDLSHQTAIPSSRRRMQHHPHPHPHRQQPQRHSSFFHEPSIKNPPLSSSSSSPSSDMYSQPPSTPPTPGQIVPTNGDTPFSAQLRSPSDFARQRASANRTRRFMNPADVERAAQQYGFAKPDRNPDAKGGVKDHGSVYDVTTVDWSSDDPNHGAPPIIYPGTIQLPMPLEQGVPSYSSQTAPSYQTYPRDGHTISYTAQQGPSSYPFYMYPEHTLSPLPPVQQGIDTTNLQDIFQGAQTISTQTQSPYPAFVKDIPDGMSTANVKDWIRHHGLYGIKPDYSVNVMQRGSVANAGFVEPLAARYEFANYAGYDMANKRDPYMDPNPLATPLANQWFYK